MIGKPLTSLQNQDYPGHLSILVVDDNSEDGTKDEIKIRVIRRLSCSMGVPSRTGGPENYGRCSRV